MPTQDSIQMPLDLNPGQATYIDGPFSYIVDGDMMYYFSFLEPFDCHPLDDRNAMLLRIARFRRINKVRVKDLMSAFNVSRSTVARAAKRWDRHGDEGFYLPRRQLGRRRTVITPELERRACELLASGMSQRACARELGVSISTFNENVRAGVIKLPET